MTVLVYSSVSVDAVMVELVMNRRVSVEAIVVSVIVAVSVNVTVFSSIGAALVKLAKRVSWGSSGVLGRLLTWIR